MSAAAQRKSAAPAGGFIYAWLLAALFLEYARPASFLPFLDIPFFYSAFPLLLFVASTMAGGLRSAQEVFSDRQVKWIFALVGVVFVSMLVFQAYAIDIFRTVLGYALLMIVIARVCTTWARVRGVIATLAFAHVFLLAMNPIVLLDGASGARHYILGATFLGDGNDFGLSLCLLLPCLFWIGQTTSSKFVKLLSYLVILLFLYTITITQSRGSTIGIGCVLLFLWWHSKKKVFGGVAIVVVCAALLAVAPAAYFDRMGKLGTSADGSAQGRLDAWKGGIGMGAKNPIFGIGAGHFGPRWGKTAHSTYVLAFGELGIPGLVCTLFIVIGNMRSTMVMRRRILDANAPPPAPDRPASERRRLGDPAPHPPPIDPGIAKLDRALLIFTTSMLGFAVAGSFLSATYYPHVYVLTGLILSVRAIAAREGGISLSDAAARLPFVLRRRAAAQGVAGKDDERPG